MGKKPTPLIVFYLLTKDFKPREIIDMGYKYTTVYRFSQKYNEVRKEYDGLKANGFKLV